MARAMKDSGIEWLGEIPEGWEVARVSSCFSEVKEKNTDNLYDNALQFKMGRIIPKPRKWDAEEIGETYSAYTIVHPGTIMVNGLNLEFDFVTQRVAIVEENGIITSAYIAMSPNDSVDADYMCYLLKAYDYRRALHNMGKGLRKILNYSELKTKPILLPPLSEQRSIVKALNTECAQIDAVIEQTRASIEEYKKLKQSVITQAVTKGIRPGRKMKASGIEWVKELPEDWAVIPSKYLFRNSDMRRLDNDEQMTASQQYGIITQAQYMELTGAKVVFANKGLEDWKHVEPYDFIISLRSFQGGLEMSETTGCITWHYIVLKPCKPIYSYYFKWLFKSELYIKALQRTCNFIRDGQDLRYSNFVQVPLFEPSLEEQKGIADYLNKKCAEIDQLISKKESFAAELESYKKSLIFEYVTGKKEVPV